MNKEYKVISSSPDSCTERFRGTKEEYEQWIKDNNYRFPGYVTLKIQPAEESAKWERDFDIHSGGSIYEQMNKIDDKESLNERYNVRNQQEWTRSIMNEGVEDDYNKQRNVVMLEKVKELIEQLDEDSCGFVTATDVAVRYMTEEMDGVYYAKIDELVKTLNDNSSVRQSVEEDPSDLTSYFTEKLFLHHAFEIEEFVENVKRLNVKYFGTETVDDVDLEFESASNDTLTMFD